MARRTGNFSNNSTSRRFATKLRKAWRRFKYLDKTKFNYFVVVTVLGLFCTFTGTTYSIFTISKYMNAANITVAKLNYTLTSEMEEYNAGVVTIKKGETLTLDLALKSENDIETKYALNYETESANVKVYYSQNLRNNMEGTIASNGASIDMRVIIVNESETEDAEVNFTVMGGYIQNSLTSNITNGYYEERETLRTILLDENYENPTLANGYPAANENYLYYKTECSEPANPEWHNDTWSLDLNATAENISCDVYFKKSIYDIELTFKVIDKSGNVIMSATAPSKDGPYIYKESYCSSSASAIWNEEEWRADISNISSKSICVVTFEENEVTE